MARTFRSTPQPYYAERAKNADNGKMNADDLKEVIKGTDYISVDENEEKTNLIVGLDKTKVDEEVKEDSENLITSGAVFEALGNNNTLTLKTLFGDMSLIGSGNIDLYEHFITLNDTIYMQHLSSSNLVCDSLQDLTTMTKAINGTKIFIDKSTYLIYENNVWKLNDGTAITKVADEVTTI